MAMLPTTRREHIMTGSSKDVRRRRVITLVVIDIGYFISISGKAPVYRRHQPSRHHRETPAV
jgi:hypothetical protein